MENNNNVDIGALILAAGKGTRMCTSNPKPLVPLKGKAIICYIIDAFKEAEVRNINIVVGYGADKVQASFGDKYTYVLQKEQKGTAHAVIMAKDAIAGYKNILIFVGDSPLIKPNTIRLLIDHHFKTDASCTFLTGEFPRPLPYARVVRDKYGKLVKCIEERIATPEEKSINEYMTSHYIFKTDVLMEFIEKIKPDSNTKELYLTDIIDILLKENLKVEIVKINDYAQLVGLNTPSDLEWAEKILRDRSKT